jgi:hypothetical protein
VAAHPLQEDPAAEDTVWPPPPLLTKPQADISRQTFFPLQAGQQSGSSFPKTSCSKSFSQVSQWYS